jgi:ABC-type lipoprotein export system ATPase subunit
LPYASLHRNIWLAQTRSAGTRGVKLDDPERILDLVGLSGQGKAKIGQLAPAPGSARRSPWASPPRPVSCWWTEPTSQLDAAGRDEVVHALETVNAERGTTIVVVTHDPEVARDWPVVTIRDGRVGAGGSRRPGLRGGGRRRHRAVAARGAGRLPARTLSRWTATTGPVTLSCPAGSTRRRTDVVPD